MRRKILLSGIAGLSILSLVGCGTTTGGAPTDTTKHQAVVNTKTTVGTNTVALTNTVSNDTSVTNTPLSNTSSPNAAIAGQKPISPSSDNFSEVGLQSPNTVYVEGNVYTPPTLVHGTLEPIVMTITFTKIQTPVYINIQNMSLKNPSSSIGGGVDYLKYNGQIYKINEQLPGAFPVKNNIVLEGDSTITFVGNVGTPAPPAKVQLNYGNMVIGTFSVTNTASFNLK